MQVSSYVPAESWAGYLENAPGPRMPVHPPPSPLPPGIGAPPAERPSPTEATAAGPLGPGAYHVTEALIRRTPVTYRFQCADRFKPTKSDRRPRSSSAPNLWDDQSPRQAWRNPDHGFPEKEGTVWLSRSDPHRLSRLRLGRANTCPDGQPPTFGGSSAAVADAVMSSTGVSTGASTGVSTFVSAGVEVSFSFDRSCEFDMRMASGHPRGRGRVKGEARPQALDAAAQKRQLRLFGGAAPTRNTLHGSGGAF